MLWTVGEIDRGFEASVLLVPRSAGTNRWERMFGREAFWETEGFSIGQVK